MKYPFKRLSTVQRERDLIAAMFRLARKEGKGKFIWLIVKQQKALATEFQRRLFS